MRTLRNLIASVLLALSAIASVNAQKVYMQDTLRLQLPNQTTLEYITNYNGKTNKIQTINIKQQLTTFLDRWKTIGAKNISSNKPIEITCTDVLHRFYNWNHKKLETNIKIKSIPAENNITISNDSSKIIVISGKNRLIFKHKPYKLTIYFNTLQQLTELAAYNWNEITKNMDNRLNKLDFKHSTYKAWLNSNENNVSLLHSKLNNPLSKSTLIINTNAGLGYIKDRWNTSIGVSLYAEIYNRNDVSFRIGVNYEGMFDFKNNNRNVNHWIDVSYSQKSFFSSGFYKISLGYLIKREGDLFKKNTFRLGFEKHIINNINVTPQIYFNGFFKDAYPGVKIGISI